MRVKTLLCAAGVIAAGMSSVARADDPNDPTMRTAEARARDHEIIRQLNLAELARDQARDAKLAEGWAAYRDYYGDDRDGGREAGRRHERAGFVPDDRYADASAEYDRSMTRYSNDRARYERRMAEWRRAVAACRAGDWDACGN